MATTTREAIVIQTSTRQPVIDLDPAQLEVTVDGFAVAEDNTVMDLWDATVELEVNTDPTSLSPMTIVWSDDMSPVRFICPECDDVCNLDDGATGDFLDGHTAMVCPDCLD